MGSDLTRLRPCGPTAVRRLFPSGWNDPRQAGTLHRRKKQDIVAILAAAGLTVRVSTNSPVGAWREVKSWLSTTRAAYK